MINFRGTYLQDWSADPNGPLSWRFQKSIAGSGAVGDIGTHVVDMAHYLVGPIDTVQAITPTYVKTRPIQQGGVDKLGASDKSSDAERAPVDVDDEVMSMVRFKSGAIGSIEATRNAWGRNNFLTLEIHGTKGSILFNYERRDELQVMFADDPGEARGFRTIYTGPAHPYGEGLWPIPRRRCIHQQASSEGHRQRCHRKGSHRRCRWSFVHSHRRHDRHWWHHRVGCRIVARAWRQRGVGNGHTRRAQRPRSGALVKVAH